MSQPLDETKHLHLPLNAKRFMVDANSMYNNIDTKHVIKVISWWLKDLDSKGQLTNNFPLEAVIYAMETIMRNNVFEWGDMFFLQLLDTVMRTSSIVMWATLYYAYHKVHKLIPLYGQFLLYFIHFIDDIFGIWIGNTTTKWVSFCDDVDNYSILTWDIKQQQLSNRVNFLDITFIIRGGCIISTTYQKEINLYLYLPFASAHPQAVFKGTVYGLINRYYAQNTYREDYVCFVSLLYHRLYDRGWDPHFIHKLMVEALRTIETKATSSPPSQPLLLLLTNGPKVNDGIYLHLQYHPNNISRRQLRSIYDEYLADHFRHTIGIKRSIVAYSRSKNIRDYLMQAKLHQAAGMTASIIMGEHKQELNPWSFPQNILSTSFRCLRHLPDIERLVLCKIVLHLPKGCLKYVSRPQNQFRSSFCPIRRI